LADQARDKDENYEILKVDALDDAKNLYSLERKMKFIDADFA